MPSPSPDGALVIEWPDGQRLSHPLPLPAGATPCEYVAMIGQAAAPHRREATWWVEPAGPETVSATFLPGGTRKGPPPK